MENHSNTNDNLPRKKNILVIGAGLAGTTAAFALKRRGGRNCCLSHVVCKRGKVLPNVRLVWLAREEVQHPAHVPSDLGQDKLSKIADVRHSGSVSASHGS